MGLNFKMAFPVLSGLVGYGTNKAIVTMGVDKLLRSVNQPVINENLDLIGGAVGLFVTAPLHKPLFDQVGKLPFIGNVADAIKLDTDYVAFGAAMWAGGRVMAGLISRAQGVGPLQVAGSFLPK